jgi:sugar phosphate isomerase/epimerase
MIAGVLLIQCTQPIQNTEPMNVGIQLYTLRDAMNEDPISTLKKVSEIGYNQIELAGYESGKFYGMDPKEFKALADSLGLKTLSTHIPLVALRTELEMVLNACDLAEIEYIVLPWLNTNERESIDQYLTLIDDMNAIGEKCAKAGFKFVYHNHDFEFLTIDGQVPMELILTKTNPDFVNLELDLFWATKAGFDPVELFQKYPGRFPLWHVKDMDATEERKFTEVGNGVIDFKRIFDAKETSGMKYFFVEQDVSVNPLKSIEISYPNVQKLL